MKGWPLALAAPGFANESEVRLMFESWNEDGFTTNGLLEPVIRLPDGAPVPSVMLWRANKEIRPTSGYEKVNGACEPAPKRSVRVVNVVTPEFGSAATPPVTDLLVSLPACPAWQAIGSLHWKARST